MPANECATSTVGPGCRASARCVASTPACSVVNGFWTAMTWIPLGWSRAMTSDQHDPSANSPCTRTTFRALGAGCAAAAYWSRGLAAPAATTLTNVRRSIGVLPLARCDPERGFHLAIGLIIPALPKRTISMLIAVTRLLWRHAYESGPDLAA